MKTLALAIITLATVAAGCADSPRPKTTADARAPAQAPSAPGSAGLGAAAATAADMQGSVLETMDAGGYTYAMLETGREKVWVAGPPVQLAVGDQVRARGTMQMHDFHSPSLDRTFAVLYFAQQIARATEGTSGVLPTGHPAPQEPDAKATTDLTGIDRPEGGTTVEEIFLKKAELIDTPIVIRGRVVKFNGGILGKNWLHIQDGTGATGTNDLTITTDATCAVGDTVLVRGKLVADRDFGAGYYYALIVEDAQVTVE